MLVLAVTKRDSGWGTPSYAILVKISDTWVVCPWFSSELLEVFASQASPQEAFSMIPPEILAEAAKIQSLDQIVRDTDELRKQSEKLVAMKDQLLDLAAKDAKTNE